MNDDISSTETATQSIAAEQQKEDQTQTLGIEYRGVQGPLFKLGAKTAILSLLTLGIYRFWAKTRLRKYFWSATAPGGDPLEYTGNGLEKLLGFLIAVTFLAIYLGILQVLLFFVGLSVFNIGDSPEAQVIQTIVSQLTVLAVLPFIFYAQYRARRYILSRTRWRGIRFGVDAAAWGYVWRALAYTLLSLLSFGLLLPRQTFYLEKYKTDRTWYGDAKFVQNGRWQQLYPAMKHYFIAFGLLIVPTALAALTQQPRWLALCVFGFIWLYYGVAYYSVETFRIMGNQKQLGDTIGFETTPRASTVFWTYILGGLLTSICAGFLFSAFAIISGNLFGMEVITNPEVLFQRYVYDELGIVEFLGLISFVLGYIVMLLSYGVFGLIFITQPVLQHYVQETRIRNPQSLEEIEQRSRDEMVEAEGFADALDVGAAL